MPNSTYHYWRGGRFNSTSIASLIVVERHAGPIRIMQGGWNAGGVSASAGTHDAGGVCDISVSGKTNAEVWSLLTWLRRCGWAAWLRTPAQGFVRHCHAVRIGDASASWGAKAQVVAYKRGRNGLAGNGRDDGPDVAVVTWEKSKYNPANSPKPRKPYVINGKNYAPYSGPVYVDSLNAARKAKKKFVSRPVHRVQLWLGKPQCGAYYAGRADGIWGPKTQAAYDQFRRRKLHWLLKRDYTGPVGLKSLRKLRDKAGSPYKVAESGGEKAY